MSYQRNNPSSAITRADLDRIERVVNKASGNIAAALGRYFEELEERIDRMENRLSGVRFDIAPSSPVEGLDY